LPSTAKTPADARQITTTQHNKCRNMFGPLASRTRPRCGASQPHKQRPPRIVLQIAHHPVGPFPPPGGKVMTANLLCIFRKRAEKLICFQ